MFRELGQWTPDAISANAPGLRICQNVRPTPMGYATVKDVRPANQGGIDDECYGVDRGRTLNGTDWLLAGSLTKLWLSRNGAVFTDVSKAGGYNTGTANWWDFTQFGQNAYATNGSDLVQVVNVSSGSPAAVDLDPDASLARTIATVGEFVVLGDIVGQNANSGIGIQEAGLHWCAIGDPSSWPVVGQQPAVDAQSDIQVFPGDGGRITNIVPVAEFAVVFRERETWRMDYVGAPAVFAFRRIDRHRGCVMPNTAIAVGGWVYYYSEEGFYRTNGATVEGIGAQRVDRSATLLTDWNSPNWASVAHDDDQRAVTWAIPSFNTGGRPGGLFQYNYTVDRWSVRNKFLERIVSQLSNAADSIMDQPPYQNANMDDVVNDPPIGMGNVNLDSLRTVNRETLAVFLRDHQFYTWDGEDFMIGTVAPHFFAHPSQNRAMLRGVRPLFTGESIFGIEGTMEASVQHKLRFSANALIKQGAPRNATGWIPVRVGSRYFSPEFTFQGAVGGFSGFDLNWVEAGRR